MARQKLAAKLDFLANHPRIQEDLGASFVRQATEDQFFKACVAQFQHGQVQSAQQLTRDYLRRYPFRWRGWLQFAKAKLPWRVGKHWMTPNRQVSTNHRSESAVTTA